MMGGDDDGGGGGGGTWDSAVGGKQWESGWRGEGSQAKMRSPDQLITSYQTVNQPLAGLSQLLELCKT